ncbi:MAG: DUF1987 domain-containing protein [Bacteroidetes bacterium]|nr:DUF1987 domain-containing protein [Bacteroidota bacterium]
MEPLKIEPTHKTPKVYFAPQENVFELSGRSIPEDSVGFYKHILDWIDDYGKSPNSLTEFNFELEYFNTSSSKNILELLKKLEGIHESGHNVKIYWYYDEDDEDMEETGEDYKALLSVPLELKMKVY